MRSCRHRLRSWRWRRRRVRQRGRDHDFEHGAFALAPAREATHWPSIRARRTPETGPSNGRPEIMVEAEAAFSATTSYASSGLTASTVSTTCTSLRRVCGNSGRNGRSMMRQARMASELGRLRSGRTSPGSCRLRTSSLPRPRSAGRSRSSPSGWNRRWSWTESSNHRQDRRRRHHPPAGRDDRSRSAACACRMNHYRLRLQQLDFGTLHRFLLCFLFLCTYYRQSSSADSNRFLHA